MKILYIHQYFKTPAEPGGTRSYWVAKELVKSGHDVTIITSAADNSHSVTKLIEGIKVIYIPEKYNQSMSVSQRMVAFAKFMAKATKISLRQANVDLVIATSTPLSVGIPALVLKWRKKIPFIFEVRDLWPEVPIQMGAIKNSFVIFLCKMLEKTIYRNASHVIALSPGMQEGVLKYVAKEKTTMIPNMSKIDKFWPREKNLILSSNLGLSRSTFKIVHFGSLGVANGADTIIQSAKLMKNDNTVEFVFLGGGATENRLKMISADNALTNVHFLGNFPMEETSDIVNLCDLSLVSFADIPILYTNSPNKLFDSLSAGKPIIVNSAGWTKELVERYKCGFYVDPSNPQDLVDKIKMLQKNLTIVSEMGNRARWLAENKFDKDLLCKEFVRIVNQEI